MLYVRLPNALEAVALNEFDNPAKTSMHVDRQIFELSSNTIVKQFYDPVHATSDYRIIAILKYKRGDGTSERGEVVEHEQGPDGTIKPVSLARLCRKSPTVASGK
jgi:hypothetical protein